MAACKKCKRQLSKLDEPKRVEERKLNGETVFFGLATGLEKIDNAKGKMVGVYHYKCYFVMKKHDRMGPNGRYLDESPTAYEMAEKYKNRDDLQLDEKQRAELAAQRFEELRTRKDILLTTLPKDQAEKDKELLDLDGMLAEADAEAKLAQRQAEIAEERAKEETPGAWSDWRDPTTLDV